MSEFMSQTELGRLYGVSSHKIGKWLMSCGLRTLQGKPSPRAFQEGFVEQRMSRTIDTYFWVWHVQKTVRVLNAASFGEVVISEDAAAGLGQ